MKKFIATIAILGMLTMTTPVSAHITITDKQLTQGYTVVTLRVPTEKPMATVGLRVVIPEGVVVHGVKPVTGWAHKEIKATTTQPATTTTSDGSAHKDEGVTKEVIWSGGSIGEGEYMEFSLSTQYTGDPKILTYKAYQTYADGSIVSWDGSDDTHPAPQVEIVKDLAIDALKTRVDAMEQKTTGQPSPMISIVALVLSIGAIAMTAKKK